MPDIYANNATFLTSSSSGTTTPVSGTVETWSVIALSSLWPAVAAPFTMSVQDPAQQTEIIRITASTGSGATSITVTRGADGTTPVAHATGATFYCVAVSSALDAFVTPISGVGPASLLSLNVMEFGADPTGTNYNDTAFANAIAYATTLNTHSLDNSYVQISGPPGVYKFNMAAGSLMIPPGVSFGGFGGGAPGCAVFNFPIQTNIPTVTALTTSATSTTLTLGNVKQNNGQYLSFPTNGSVPQWCNIGSYHACTYTGVTNNGTATPTLTGVVCVYSAVGQANPPVSTLGGNGKVIAGPAIQCLTAGGQGTWSLDHTITVFGPGYPGGVKPTFGTTTTGAVTPGTTTSIPLTAVSATGWTSLPSGGCECMIVGPQGTVCFTYTGITSTTLTGVTWFAGQNTTVIPSGSTVLNITPPMLLDGVYVGTAAGIDCNVVGFRMGSLFMGDHEQWGPHFTSSGCYAYVCSESPSAFNWAVADTGNQSWHAGGQYSGAFWSSFYVTANSTILNGSINSCGTMGFAPWAFLWKERIISVTNAVATAIGGVALRDVEFENPGLGIMGCPDMNANVNIVMDNCVASWESPLSITPNGVQPVSDFAIGGRYVWIGGNVFLGSSGTWPLFMTNFFMGYAIGQNQSLLNGMITSRANLGVCSTSTTNIWFTFPGGRIVACGSAVTKGTVLASNGALGTDPPDMGVLISSGASGGTPQNVIGIAAAAFTASATNVGPMIVSQDWGTVPVKVNTAGDITANSWVCDNGAAAAGTAKSITSTALYPPNARHDYRTCPLRRQRRHCSHHNRPSVHVMPSDWSITPQQQSSIVITPLSPESVCARFLTPASLFASATWQVANKALYYPFTVSVPTTIVAGGPYNGSTATGNFDVGIYDDQQNAITTLGSTAQSGTTAWQVVAFASPVTLDPGLYYMALAFSSTSSTYFGVSAGGSGNPLRTAGVLEQASALPLPTTTATFATTTVTAIPLFALSTRTWI